MYIHSTILYVAKTTAVMEVNFKTIFYWYRES